MGSEMCIRDRVRTDARDTLRLLGAIQMHCNRAVYVSLNTNANPNPEASGKMRICGHADLRIEQRVKCGRSLRIFSADLTGKMRMRIF